LNTVAVLIAHVYGRRNSIDEEIKFARARGLDVIG